MWSPDLHAWVGFDVLRHYTQQLRENEFLTWFYVLASAKKQINVCEVFCELFRLACVFVVLGRFSF